MISTSQHINLFEFFDEMSNVSEISPTVAARFQQATAKQFMTWIPSNGGRLRFATIIDNQSQLPSSWALKENGKKIFHTIIGDLNLNDDFQMQLAKPICFIEIQRDQQSSEYTGKIAIAFYELKSYNQIIHKHMQNMPFNTLKNCISSNKPIVALIYNFSFDHYGLCKIGLQNFFTDVPKLVPEEVASVA